MALATSSTATVREGAARSARTAAQEVLITRWPNVAHRELRGQRTIVDLAAPRS